jgi:hypothetical protein
MSGCALKRPTQEQFADRAFAIRAERLLARIDRPKPKRKRSFWP